GTPRAAHRIARPLSSRLSRAFLSTSRHGPVAPGAASLACSRPANDLDGSHWIEWCGRAQGQPPGARPTTNILSLREAASRPLRCASKYETLNGSLLLHEPVAAWLGTPCPSRQSPAPAGGAGLGLVPGANHAHGHGADW